MVDLNINKLTYIIIDNIQEYKNILIGNGYALYEMLSHNGIGYSNSYIAIINSEDEKIEEDCNTLIQNGLDKFFVKYNKKDKIYKYENNKYKLQEITYFPIEINESYNINNATFKFKNLKEYTNIKDKEELKNGMVVEVCDKNKWISKTIQNIDEEYDTIYKLMIKYNKVRIEKMD